MSWMGVDTSAAGLTLLAAALLSTACGCGGEPIEHVVQRLGPADFLGVPVRYHGAVAIVGGEARAVVSEPETTRVAWAFDLEPKDGRVRAEFELPGEVRETPRGAFVLSVQRYALAIEVTPKVLEKLAFETYWKKVDRGWRLEIGPDGRVVLEYETVEVDDERIRYSLRLDVVGGTPSRLESRPFQVPPAAHVELAYGSTTAVGVGDPVRFSAGLRCAKGETRELVAATARPSERTWRDVRAPLPAGSGPCRLSLSVIPDTKDLEGRPVRGAVWAVPRIVAPLAGPGSDARNLVLISLDTLRADHLSGYGYTRRTSPVIDAELIARGTTFLDVTSPFPMTDVAHMSAFSGLYSTARPRRDRLAPDTPIPLLAERLRDAGFETAAFTEDALIAGSFGFWFGFDRFTERAYRREERGFSTMAGGVRYLREHRNRRFFLFLHTYRTHHPYVSRESSAALFANEAGRSGAHRGVPPGLRSAVDAYDRTIREVDELVGDVLTELEALGLAERTLVVLLSDHGEAFGEHGSRQHGFSGFQEELRVPLVFRGPGVPAGRRVEAPVSLVDVTPTLLEWFGLPPLERAQGISLVPALRGSPLSRDRPLYFSWLFEEAAGVRRGGWKYLRDGKRRRFFDLENDPRERNPRPRGAGWQGEELLAPHEEESRRLREHFEAATAPDAVPTAISEETEESLRALGYLE